MSEDARTGVGDLAEMKFYKSGWIVRVWRICLRYNHQQHYTAFSVEKLGPSYASTKGITWREFRLARKQEREARDRQRQAHTL